MESQYDDGLLDTQENLENVDWDRIDGFGLVSEGRHLVEIEKVLPWREKGWVTADTHVHFLSPTSALLEGAAEGVNVINLLASQWGELMTNVGDFDGRNTWGSRETGGEGEYLVRVGTENRQFVLGHISLVGYSGRIIAPIGATYGVQQLVLATKQAGKLKHREVLPVRFVPMTGKALEK